MIAVAATMCISQASAECSLPEPASIPDGANATNEEMVGAQTHVKQYIADMELYIICLDQEAASLEEPPTVEQTQRHTQLHNSAVDSMEAVAAQFNEQVRAYKQANP
jgi:hypothetical protein